MITTRDRKFYNLALKVAELSDCNQKHGALIVSGARIISLACNKRRSNPTSDRYKLAIDQKRTTHAEQRALIFSRSNVMGMTLYSARINGTNKSCPCAMCHDLLIDAGIRVVVYHNGKELIKERL